MIHILISSFEIQRASKLPKLFKLSSMNLYFTTTTQPCKVDTEADQTDQIRRNRLKSPPPKKKQTFLHRRNKQKERMTLEIYYPRMSQERSFFFGCHVAARVEGRRVVR